MNSFKKLMKQYLLNNNLTCRDFCKKNNIVEQTMTKWLTGKYIPTRKNITKLIFVTDGFITKDNFDIECNIVKQNYQN